jgi:hypothetical protein
MKKYLTTFLSPALFVLASTLAVPAYSADENATANMEILRQKVSADKKLLVAANMSLTDAEAKAFWPIYNAYQADLKKINERTAKLIDDYAAAYNNGAVTNDTAKKLLDQSLAIDMDEVKLKQSYVPKLGKALPATKVARYMQIENKIRALVRYELAAQIPLVE